MDELGYVVALQKEYAVVNIKRHSACGSCHACEMGKSGKDEINISVKNDLDAQVGDSVQVQMYAPDILMAAFVVYMIPLLALLGGITGTYLLGKRMGGINEWTMILAGFVCLALSLGYVRYKDKKLSKSNRFEPKMIKVHRGIV